VAVERDFRDGIDDHRAARKCRQRRLFLGYVTHQLECLVPFRADGKRHRPVNSITLDRYHVRYIRADGRNVQGVDVPYAFDGGMTLTVGTSEVSGVFTIVRNIAKDEAPLKALTVNGVIISTIAEVTFYGHDQTGRELSAVATISVDFGNFGDKTS